MRREFFGSKGRGRGMDWLHLSVLIEVYGNVVEAGLYPFAWAWIVEYWPRSASRFEYHSRWLILHLGPLHFRMSDRLTRRASPPPPSSFSPPPPPPSPPSPQPAPPRASSPAPKCQRCFDRGWTQVKKAGSGHDSEYWPGVFETGDQNGCRPCTCEAGKQHAERQKRST